MNNGAHTFKAPNDIADEDNGLHAMYVRGHIANLDPGHGQGTNYTAQQLDAKNKLNIKACNWLQNRARSPTQRCLGGVLRSAGGTREGSSYNGDDIQTWINVYNECCIPTGNLSTVVRKRSNHQLHIAFRET